MAEVLAVGELLVDFLGEDGASLEESSRFRAAAGGAPGNVAVAAARAGAQVAFAGRVGDDPFGRRLRAALESAGVDCTALRVDGAPTTLAFVLPTARGPHGFVFVRGADARLRPEDLGPALFEGLGALVCGGVSLSASPARWAVLHALRAARAAGALSVFDVNYRPALWPSPRAAAAAFREAMALADVVKCNEAELSLLAGGEGPVEERARPLLGAPGPAAIVVTLGERGAVWVGRAASAWHEGYAVPAVDAIGAGDCFTGTLLAWWVDRQGGGGRAPAPDGTPGERVGALPAATARQLLARCNAAAALSTLRPGAMGAMPHRAEVDRFLEERER